ncbi:unnamed protein product [Coffea canephora]|uniref:Uncharacterized protein n=1 Tax=Coffea canephora TaxID=49390 RepID=A0A068UGS9_COFCA|nr:unnamed protein product [Coffea canephora]
MFQHWTCSQWQRRRGNSHKFHEHQQDFREVCNELRMRFVIYAFCRSNPNRILPFPFPEHDPVSSTVGMEFAIDNSSQIL